MRDQQGFATQKVPHFLYLALLPTVRNGYKRSRISKISYENVFVQFQTVTNVKVQLLSVKLVHLRPYNTALIGF